MADRKVKHAARYGGDYRARRRELLAEPKACHWGIAEVCTGMATEADHVGVDLVPACSACNNARSVEAAAAARRLQYVPGL